VLTRYGDTFQVNRNASPTLVDMDGDGDLDLLSGAENGRFAYFENGGSATAPAFARATPPPPFDVLDVGYDSAPRFFDLDRDGDLDAMIGGRTGGSSGARDTLRFLLRDGSGYLESSAYPPLSLARNPVPLGLRLPEGTVVLVGDLSGGIKALLDTALPSGIGVRVETGIRIALDGARVRVAWDGPAEASVSLVDLRGRTVRAASIAGGSGAVGFEELPSGVYLFAIDVAGERRTVLISHRR
jgi:hypothetical protein